MTFFISRQVAGNDELRFSAQKENTHKKIENALQTYVTILRAGSGLLSASERVTQEEFKTFVEKLELRNRYPGVQGIGYSMKIRDPSQMEGLYPAGDREEFHKIIYLEPQDIRNQKAIGYDMFSEPVRKKAMEQARDTGQPTMTGKVTLVQEIDDEVQPGFLIYIPIYQGGKTPQTLEQRRDQLLGFIYSPFRSDDFLDSLSPQVENTLIEFAIYDEDLGEENKIYQTQGMESISTSSFAYQDISQVNVGGHTWQVVTKSTSIFARTSERFIVPIVFFAGLILSFVLFILNYIQLKSQENKIEILEGITDGFISVTHRWKVSYVNQRGAAMFDKEPL